MTRRRKLKFKYKVRRFIFIIIILFIIYLIYNLITNMFYGGKGMFDFDLLDVLDKNEVLSFNITDDSESDSEIVDVTFMDGMALDDFKDVLEYKPEVLESSDEYNRIYYDFDEIMSYSDLEDIYKMIGNSKIANVMVIGKSVDNRNIYGIEIGNGDRVLFIDANIHAAEVANTLILTRFLSELVNNYEENDEDTINLLNNVKIAVIPSINPDGYEVYNFGANALNNKNLWVYKNRNSINFDSIKSNANGVDLNRNFPTQNVGMYYKGKSLKNNTSLEKTALNNKYFNGYSAGSEPEIKAAMYFMLKHYKNIYSYINMHSQGRVIYAGKPNLSNEFNNLSQDFAIKIKNITNYRVHGVESEEVGEGNDGSATDFMSELAHNFSFSSKTLRLKTDKYINNSSKMVYNYPVITIETMKIWTKDPSYFKNEYYENGIRDLLYELIKK